MGRPEASAWKLLRPFLLAHRLDPVRVENPVHPGTPDVNLTGCWIELKAITRFPARSSTIVRIPTYTQQQRVWLLRRWRAGGDAWLALYVQSCRLWFLFDGEAAQQVGRVPYMAAQQVGRAPVADLARLCITAARSEGIAEFLAKREPGFRYSPQHGRSVG